MPVVHGAALDNQWATYFVVDAVNGFAPPAWQAQVGPVVLFRPDGADLSIKEACCMQDFLDRLLDRFGDVEPGGLLDQMTPQHFERFQTEFNEVHDETGSVKGAWDQMMNDVKEKRVEIQTRGLVSSFVRRSAQ